MKTVYSFPVNAILLIGPTGAGKSPLGELLVRNGLSGKKAYHLDFGAELRAIISRNDSSLFFSTPEITFISSVLEHGLLLEDQHFSLARKIIKCFLDRSGFSDDDLLILNGIPRHAGQANDIATVAIIHTLIVLVCPSDGVFCRLRDNVGGDRRDRRDDDSALVEKKLCLFTERTAPLVEYYRNAGAMIVPISVGTTTTAEDAYHQVLSTPTGHPPVPLFTEPPQR